MDASPRPLLLLLAVLVPCSAWPTPWPASRRAAPWPGKAIANVQVRHRGQTGHHNPQQQQQQQPDLTTAAQTYTHYEHYDSRTPHQPTSMYQEFRLQQQHPHTAQYAATDAAAATTTYSPTYYTEAATVRPTTLPPTTHRHAAYTHAAYTHAAPTETTTVAPAPQPAAKSLQHRDEIEHELQMQLSQQIQVQLEQLQKLHELQHKMLHTKAAAATSTTPAPLQAVQQGSELVHRQVPVPHREQHVEYVPQQGPPPNPALVPYPHPHVGGVTAATPVTYASPLPSVTPSPPPLTEPRYPEESQSLTSFIGETSSLSPPVGDAISNGFQPMPPPRPPHPSDSAGQGFDDNAALSFQPFTEDATDPALPFYLLPPAEDSDSQFNRLREAVVPAPAPDGEADEPEGPSAPPTSSASSEHFGDHPYRHSVRGKHRLRPPRGKGSKGPKGSGRKYCSGARPCPVPARPFDRPRPHVWGPVGAAAPSAASGESTAAGSALRLRIASPMIRFRDPVDPRAPLTLMARHPGAPGRPPVTVMHVVQRIRVIKRT